MALLELWVKPGCARDALSWDPWRNRWVVSCRAPPREGAANRAVARLMAEWLGMPLSSITWDRAGTGRAKLLRVEGLTGPEAARRLRQRNPDR